MSVEKAIVIGCQGQDGQFLSSSLRAKGIETIGIGKKKVVSFSSATEHFADSGVENLIFNFDEIKDLIFEYKPTEIYYLAAYHTSSEVTEHESALEYEKSHNTHVIGLLNVLNSIRDLSLSSKLFYAASALVFDGDNSGEKVKESRKFSPVGYYGLTKAQGAMLCEYYRRKYAIFAAVGYLYNHESYLRPNHFLSKKIIKAAYDISKGSKEPLLIGNLSSIVDWGYAEDYVEAFQSIMKLKTSDDFVIATGEGHSVKEFISMAFAYFQLDSEKYVIEDPSLQKRQTPPRIGDPSNLITATGWRPTYTFEGMIKKLIEDYIQKCTKDN